EAVDGGDGERRAVVDIAVVAQHVAGGARGARKRRVGGVDPALDHRSGIGVGIGDRRVIGAGDGDGERGGGGGAVLVGDGVLDGVVGGLFLRLLVGLGFSIVESGGFAFRGEGGHRALGAFPTRRSSDLEAVDGGDGERRAVVDIAVVAQHVAGGARGARKRRV